MDWGPQEAELENEFSFRLFVKECLCVWVCVCVCVCVLIAQSCLTLCDPMDCSPQGSSVHGILQARILECVDIPFSRGSSQTRDWTQVSCIPAVYCLSHQENPY